MSKSPPNPEHEPRHNCILAALHAPEYARLLPALESVPMPLGWTMSESGDHVNYLHFPTAGIVSLIYDLEDGSSSEIALVGNEGMVGISIFMGAKACQAARWCKAQGVPFDSAGQS